MHFVKAELSDDQGKYVGNFPPLAKVDTCMSIYMIEMSECNVYTTPIFTSLDFWYTNREENIMCFNWESLPKTQYWLFESVL